MQPNKPAAVSLMLIKHQKKKRESLTALVNNFYRFNKDESIFVLYT